jgi:ABC-type nitrate/sulfonate/bicarbonate transport system substrate-binding protein
MAIANGEFEGQIIAPRHGYTAEEIARAKKEPLYPGELLLQTVLLVNKNSTINSWKDLEKRKVAVRSFKGSDQAGVMLAMRSSGANPSKVEWLSMTDAQMSAALDRGDIDAAVPADPNASQMILKGARVIGYPYAFYAKPGAAIVFISSKGITFKKPQAMRAFKKATAEINRLLNQPENQASFRKSIAKFTGVSEEAANKGRLPTMIEGEVRFSDYSYLPKELKSLGFTKNRIDLAPILFR